MKALFDALGLKYHSEVTNRQENKNIIDPLELRSKNLKSAEDAGVSIETN